MINWKTLLLIALIATVTSTRLIASTQVTLKSGEVSFLAIGKPSSLKVRGKGGSPQGVLTIENNLVSGVITFDLTSLTTGISLRDTHMKEKYLDTKNFPIATLKIDKLELPKEISEFPQSTGLLNYKANLTLKGITQVVQSEVKIKKNNQSYDIESEFIIKLSDYKIDIPKYLGITIAEDVTVHVETHAESTNSK